MGDDDKTLGKIEAILERVGDDIREIKEGKMAMCQLHSAALERIEARLNTRGRDKDSSGSSKGGVGFFGSAVDITTPTGAKVHTTAGVILFLGVIYLIARAHGINLP